MIWRVPSPTGTTDIVIFGASGDLTRNKILPALRGVAAGGQLLRLIGAGRTDQPDGGWQKMVADATGDPQLAEAARWYRLDYDSPETYASLKQDIGDDGPVVFYLATPPVAFDPIVHSLSTLGLSRKGDHWRRVVVEKPLGTDYESARRLNQQLSECFEENQVFRIDHYLAKDTVQNVLAFRFSNSLFEPNWDRTMIHSIQITAAEAGDIGSRAGYYDHSGAVRDMVQNHVLQVLALT